MCALLIGSEMILDRRSGASRVCRPGDIALLAPTGSDLWRYEEALERHGIPVATQAGKGLFRRQEIQDLIALTRVLAEASRWAAALRAGTSLTALATRTGHSKSYLRARLPLAFLAPPLQAAILEGRQSPDLYVVFHDALMGAEGRLTEDGVIGIDGTPLFVIGDAMLRGFKAQAQLESALAKARPSPRRPIPSSAAAWT